MTANLARHDLPSPSHRPSSAPHPVAEDLSPAAGRPRLGRRARGRRRPAARARGRGPARRRRARGPRGRGLRRPDARRPRRPAGGPAGARTRRATSPGAPGAGAATTPRTTCAPSSSSTSCSSSIWAATGAGTFWPGWVLLWWGVALAVKLPLRARGRAGLGPGSAERRPPDPRCKAPRAGARSRDQTARTPDKGKPLARVGRKATGLPYGVSRVAEGLRWIGRDALEPSSHKEHPVMGWNH